MERDTIQRRAIRRALRETPRPLGAFEILKASKSYAPGLGIATVYRNMRELVDDKEVITVEFPGEPPRYELAGKEHHHHFHCRTCTRIFELEGCPGHLARLVPKGFEMEGHEIVINGLCSDCSARS